MIDEPLPPDQRRRLRMVGAGLTVGALCFLGVMAFLRSRMAATGDQAIGYVGVGLASLSPILAHWLRGRVIEQAQDTPMLREVAAAE